MKTISRVMLMVGELKHSIVVYVIVAIVSTVTLALTVVSVFGYQAYSREQWSEIKSELNQSASKLADGVTLAVWNFDAIQIRKIMESTMQDEDVSGIRLVAGDVIYSLARDDKWNSRAAREADFNAADLLMEARDINYSEQSIGKLQLYVTPRFLLAKLKRTQKYLVVAVVSLDLLLIFTLYYFAWRYVLRPLKLIQAYAMSISSGDKENAVALTQPLVGEFRQLRNSLNTMVDLLELRLTELKQSNDRFWRMVSGFPVALGIYSPQTGQIIYLNKKFTEVFGYSHEEVAHANDWFEKAYPDPDYRQQVINIWVGKIEEAIQHDKEVESLPYSVTCKDGRVKTIEIGGVSSGDYIMAVFNDITERKQAEASVQAYQDHLEDLVEQRTQELVEARDHAEAANRAKSIFLANMSHELRTPLNSVIGFSQMMAKESALTSRQQRNLEIINRSGNHLLTLINDILELSKIEAGKLDMHREPVDVLHLLNEIADMLRPRADQAGISLLVEASGLATAVLVDIAKLRQVLLNLVTNAIKFTHQGGVTLVGIGQRDNGTIRVEFRVSDTGIGIAPEFQSRVFEPFVQVDTSGQRSGTGLGLSISRQYVQMLGGVLALQSVSGEGSTFCFSLMLPVAHLPQPVASPAATTLLSYPGRRVMIVDDMAEMRMLLHDLLEPLGLEILQAENGVKANDLIQQFKPNLLLVDWRMPLMNGMELTRLVRNRHDITQPKIIMLTAQAFDEDRDAALEAGVDDFMSKPIDVKILYGLINKYIGNGADAVTAEGSTDNGKLTPADVAVLSSATRREFEVALRELSPTKIHSALQQIAAEAPELAKRIERYTEAMQYRQLWQIFDLIKT